MDLNANDIKEKKAKRGADGELIPETHTIEWDGEEKEVKPVPITTGVINELSHIDKEIQRLEPSAVHEAMQVIYVEPNPAEFDESDIQDLPFKYLEALMKPLDEQMSAEIGDEGNTQKRQERAKRMR